MDVLKRSLGLSGSSGATSSAAPPASNNGNNNNNNNSGSSTDVKQRLVSAWNSVKYGKAAWTLDAATAAKSGFAKNQPVYLLGRCYHRKMFPSSVSASSGLSALSALSSSSESAEEISSSAAFRAFLSDVTSKLWLTYRREFVEFRGTTLNTDCGWGCMIRSGQMLLANTLLLHFFDRDWRWNRNPASTLTSEQLRTEHMHRSIIRLFGDCPEAASSPLSIHRLMTIAAEVLGRSPGDWFGPGATAHLLKEAVSRSSHPLLENLAVYVATDCAIFVEDAKQLSRKRAADLVIKRGYGGGGLFHDEEENAAAAAAATDDFSFVEHPTEHRALCAGRRLPDLYPDEDLSAGVTMAMAAEDDFQLVNSAKAGDGNRDKSRSPTSSSPDSTWTPLLVLAPVRLGGDRLNPIYAASITSVLTTDDCVGIIGGRPKHSLYFLGFQDDCLIHLDPHLVQDSVDVFSRTFSLDSFHCAKPRKINIAKMDPSCCIGFYFKTEKQFDGWCGISREMFRAQTQYPMIDIVDGTREAFGNALGHAYDDCDAASISSAEDASEDFVFL